MKKLWLLLFAGSYKLNGNDLNFGPLAATRAACMAGMDTESSINKDKKDI